MNEIYIREKNLIMQENDNTSSREMGLLIKKKEQLRINTRYYAYVTIGKLHSNFYEFICQYTSQSGLHFTHRYYLMLLPILK